MIAVRGVSLCAGDHRVLEEVSLSVETGTVLAVVGPNGVGKTTLLRAVAGLHSLESGSIAIDGVDVASLPPRARARRIAFLGADDTPVESLSVRDVVGTARYTHHRWWEWRETSADASAIATALAEVGIGTLAQREFSTLSSGERRNAWIAFALAQETPALLLDEPTTHLDLHVAQRMLALLRALARAGRTVVCALHDLNEAAAYADTVALFGSGRLRSFGPPDVVLSSPIVDEVYECPVERVRLRDGSLRVYPSGERTALER